MGHADISRDGCVDFGVGTGFSSRRRLSSATRELAARAVAGEFGATIGEAKFSLDPVAMAPLSETMHCAHAVTMIAERAPVRLLPGEMLVGSATLLEATRHKVPLTSFDSVSHTTIGFERGLREGYAGVRCEIESRLEDDRLDASQREFLSSMLMCVAAAGVWHGRYVALLERRVSESQGAARSRYESMLAAMKDVPERPAGTFREALQSLWLMWCFQRLCGNWSGIGRIDKMLGPYLSADMSAGLLTLDEARELIAHFWIKGCEWIGRSGGNYGGDAQYYQNIVLGGIDASGRDVVNDVTYLVLDVVEELHISDFPIAVRVNSRTEDRLLRRIAEVQRRGGGIVAIYNEGLIIRALERFGYATSEAREFANDGCWEMIVPGKTAFSYWPFDMLKVLQDAMGLGDDESEVPACLSFDEFYDRFVSRLGEVIAEFHCEADKRFRGQRPTPLLSLLVDGCIERARGYFDRGSRYTILACHAGGLPDTANSLLAIKRLVFDEKRLTLDELVDVLRADWAGHELLRREVQRRLVLYGNDDDQADAMARRVYDDFVALVDRVRERDGVLRPAGISTFGREISFRAHRLATAFGAKRGEILATNLGPTPGTDSSGPTAVTRSYCAMDFEKLANGAPLELKILPASLVGERGLDVLTSLMRAFVELGGVFLHIDVVDTELLRDAQRSPERYRNLSVRISGWSARFVTLSQEWQEMIINRTQQRV